jgi:type II secretory pathway predicted ATPase ExeA
VQHRKCFAGKGGNLLVTGPIGCGKLTLVRLASFIAGRNLSELYLDSRPEMLESTFLLEFRKIYTAASVLDQTMTVMIPVEAHMTSILEVLSELLSTGLASIFTNEEADTMVCCCYSSQ